MTHTRCVRARACSCLLWIVTLLREPGGGVMGVTHRHNFLLILAPLRVWDGSFREAENAPDCPGESGGEQASGRPGAGDQSGGTELV